MQIAESALLEKEQASIREQQLTKEVERLRATVATILKEAGERTRREVDIIQAHTQGDSPFYAHKFRMVHPFKDPFAKFVRA